MKQRDAVLGNDQIREGGAHSAWKVCIFRFPRIASCSLTTVEVADLFCFLAGKPGKTDINLASLKVLFSDCFLYRLNS